MMKTLYGLPFYPRLPSRVERGVAGSFMGVEQGKDIEISN